MALSEIMQGNGEMPDERLDKVREGIRLMQELEHDREMLRTRLNDTLQRCSALQAELGAIQVAQARITTELENYRRERDAAVEGRAEAVAVLKAAATILQQQVDKSKTVPS